MGPPGPREELQRAIAATGCRVRFDPARGGMVAVDCPSSESKARMVDALAWSDALYDGEVRLLALHITRDLPRLTEAAIVRCVFEAVRDRCRFVGEGGELIQDPIVTWSYRAGDCDCHARLVLALLRALGVPCAMVGFHVPGPNGKEFIHASPAWFPRPEEVVWMETTLPGAALGEHPMDAARRLFSQRPELQS